MGRIRIIPILDSCMEASLTRVHHKCVCGCSPSRLVRSSGITRTPTNSCFSVFLSISKTDTFGGSGWGPTRPNVRSHRQIIAFGVWLRRLCATCSMITSLYKVRRAVTVHWSVRSYFLSSTAAQEKISLTQERSRMIPHENVLGGCCFWHGRGCPCCAARRGRTNDRAAYMLIVLGNENLKTKEGFDLWMSHTP
jgi:hypothetical protein